MWIRCGVSRARGDNVRMQELPLEVLRQRVDAWAETTTFRQRGFAATMPVQRVAVQVSHHVRLESQYEERTTAWEDVPYPGGPVDGSENGPVPGPWEMRIPDAPPWFDDTTKRYDVPHSESVLVCPRCDGARELRCGGCGGSQRVACSACGGDGRVVVRDVSEKVHANGRRERRVDTRQVSCGPCGGRGRVVCSTCAGSGKVPCTHCNCMGRVKRGLVLTVRWQSRVAEPVVAEGPVPEDLVRRSAGTTALQEESARLDPTGESFATGPFREGRGRVDPRVDASINALLVDHHAVPRDAQLRCQRLLVRAVLLHWVFYRHKDTDRTVCLVGEELNVVAPDYPASTRRVAVAVGGGAAILTGLIAAGYSARTSPISGDVPTQEPIAASVPITQPAALSRVGAEAGLASVDNETITPSASVSAAEVRPGDLVPPSLPDFTERRDGPLAAIRPEEQVSTTFYAADGARVALTVQRSEEALEAGRPTMPMRIQGHSARRLDDRLFTWVGWRSGPFLFLTWCYPPRGQLRISTRRLGAALEAIARWSDARIPANAAASVPR